MLPVVCHLVVHEQQLHYINNLFSFAVFWEKGLDFQACCRRWGLKGLNLLIHVAGSIDLGTFEGEQKGKRAEPHLTADRLKSQLGCLAEEADDCIL